MEQSIKSDRLLISLSKGGVFRAKELEQLGFHRAVLSRFVKNGRIQRLSRGIYCLPNHDLTEWHDFAEISKAVPKAVFGLLSALAFHEIGTQVPHESWITLPKNAWIPKTRHRLRVSRQIEPYYSAGIEEHVIESVPVRIYSPAKTVADCFRMRNHVGYDVAVEALREGWRERKFTADELIRYAKVDRVERVMRPYLEALIL